MILIASKIKQETHKVDLNYIVAKYGSNIATARIGRNDIAIVCKSNIENIKALRIVTSAKGNIIKANGYGQMISRETYLVNKLSQGNKLYILYEEIAIQK